MKSTIRVVLVVAFIYCVALLGSARGYVLNGDKKPFNKNEILTLKSIIQLFGRSKLYRGLVRDGFSETAVRNDPHCPPGFQRAPTGFCREVW